MRTRNIFAVTHLLLYLLLSALSAKAAINLLTEDWEAGNTNQWNSWGSPLPVLNSSTDAIGTYSLDPNGDGSYHSGVVSSQMFSLSSTIQLSIDAYIESASSWSELEFGLVDTNSIPTNPNTNDYTIAKVMLDADTQNSGYKLYASFVGDGGSQTISKNESATNYFNAWHSFTFDFASDGSATIAIDDQTIFSSDAGIFNYSTASNFAIMLAGRSYSTADNLYDNVELIQIPEPAHAGSVLGLLAATLLLLRRKRK